LGGGDDRIVDSRDGTLIDLVLRCEDLRITQINPILNRAGHSCQAEREQACELLPSCAHSTVSEVVDVVDVTLAVLEVDQLAYDRDDILRSERQRVAGHIKLEPLIDAIPSDVAQVIALFAEEEPVQDAPGRIEIGCLA